MSHCRWLTSMACPHRMLQRLGSAITTSCRYITNAPPARQLRPSWWDGLRLPLSPLKNKPHQSPPAQRHLYLSVLYIACLGLEIFWTPLLQSAEMMLFCRCDAAMMTLSADPCRGTAYLCMKMLMLRMRGSGLKGAAPTMTACASRISTRPMSPRCLATRTLVAATQKSSRPAGRSSEKYKLTIPPDVMPGCNLTPRYAVLWASSAYCYIGCLREGCYLRLTSYRHW